jgi:hypothetical protein
MAEMCSWFWIKVLKPFVIVLISEMDEQLNNSCELRNLSAWPLFFAPINVRHVTLETNAEMYVKSFRYFGPVLTAIEIWS